jgi:hypothetical protein
MAITVKNIIPRKHAENSQTTQYTATNCKTIIDKFTATNTSAVNVNLSVNLPASGGSASDSNLVLDERGIAPGESYTCPELVGQTLEAGGFISTLASSAASITISASGREITS